MTTPGPKYVLFRDDTGHLACDVRLHSSRPGKYGAIDPSSILRHPDIRTMAPEHRRLLMQLVMHCTTSARRNVLRDANGFALVREMVHSGHAYWLRSDGPALRWGEARQTALVWKVHSGGLYEPGLAPSETPDFVLPLTPPLFIDVHSRTCGPITADIQDAATGEWAEPRATMNLDAAIAFCNAMARRHPKASFPLPEATRAALQQDRAPTPCLLVASRTLWSETQTADLAAVPIVRLTFDYGFASLTLAAPEEVIVVLHEGQVLRCARDRQAEAKASERLRALGFVPVEEAFTASVTTPLRDWCLRPDAPGDWAAVQASVLPDLAGTGWTIKQDERCHIEAVGDTEWFSELEADEKGWFDFAVGIRVGRKRVNLLPVVHQFLVQNRSRNTEEMGRLLEGRQFPVPVEKHGFALVSGSRLFLVVRHLLELFEQPPKGGERSRLRLDLWRAAEIGQLEQLAVSPWQRPAALRSLSERLARVTRLSALPGPAPLQAELRPYQQLGLAWLQFLRESSFDGILADDMGLGKTVQTLAHVLMEKTAGRLGKPCLIVTPTSVIQNWVDETHRFAPSLTLLVLHGSDRKEEFEKVAGADIVLTSYALLRRDAGFLQRQEFALVVLDEGHYIKNHRAQTAQAACSLQAARRLCLTGTPLENHLGELWALFNFLMPGFLGSYESFNERFRGPIEKDGSEVARQFLSRRIAPFLLRRRKSEVERDLPPKTITVHRVELGERQRELYEAVRLAMQARIRDEVESRGLARSQITILDALLKLRQICCDPRLAKTKTSPATTAEDSAKLQGLMDMLTEMLEEGRRVLLFSQFVGMLELIQTELRTLNIDYALLTGQTRDRATPIRRFQEREVGLFLISLKAGGTGLNLTAADTVIHYDPWWNPAAETQATDRAHRIGQDKPVFVYRLLTIGTVEERIQAMQERKQKLADSILKEQRAGSIRFTMQDLDALFAPITKAP